MKITYYGHSCFAVQCGKFNLLFDPFISPNPKAKDIDLSTIKANYILISHAHGDHIGSLDALHKALPDADVMISERDARFLTGDMRLDPHEPQAKLRGSFQKVTTRPDRSLHDGDRVGSLRPKTAQTPDGRR